MADLAIMGVIRHAVMPKNIFYVDSSLGFEAKPVCVCVCVWLMNFRDCNWGPPQTVLAGGLEANNIFRDAYKNCVCVQCSGLTQRGWDYILAAASALFSMLVLIQTHYIWLRKKEGRTDSQSKVMQVSSTDSSRIHK